MKTPNHTISAGLVLAAALLSSTAACAAGDPARAAIDAALADDSRSPPTSRRAGEPSTTRAPSPYESEADEGMRESANDVARDMFSSYRAGGVGDMYVTERNCWAEVQKLGKAEKFGGYGICAMHTAAGGYIEATYAKHQGRVPAPNYQPQEIGNRLAREARKLGISERERLSFTESTLAPYLGLGMLEALANAGMR